MLDDWLSDAWPPEVVTAMRLFVQGDLIESPPVFFSGASKYAVTSFVRTTGDPNEVEELFDIDFDSRPPYGLLTTETCDIVEETDRPRQPFVLVAPVYNLAGRIDARSEGLLSSNRIGYMRYLGDQAMPPGFWVADLRLEVPIEKSCLVGRTPIRPLVNESDRLLLAQFLAARRDRPVLGEKVHKGVIRPLRRWVEKMNDSKRELTLAGIADVRLGIAGARSGPDGVGLILVAEGSTVADETRTIWDNRWPYMKRAAHDADLILLETEYSSLDKLSARRYLESVPIDLQFE